MGAVNKKIVAFDITMDYRRALGMQINKSLEDLSRPSSDDLNAGVLQFFNVPNQERRERG